jgi:hypothetical protein
MCELHGLFAEAVRTACCTNKLNGLVAACSDVCSFNRFNATKVKYWCYLRQGNTCNEVTESEIETFAVGFESCMSYAASQGLDIAVNARVDDGLGLVRRLLSIRIVRSQDV